MSQGRSWSWWSPKSSLKPFESLTIMEFLAQFQHWMFYLSVQKQRVMNQSFYVPVGALKVHHCVMCLKICSLWKFCVGTCCHSREQLSSRSHLSNLNLNLNLVVSLVFLLKILLLQKHFFSPWLSQFLAHSRHSINIYWIELNLTCLEEVVLAKGYSFSAGAVINHRV